MFHRILPLLLIVGLATSPLRAQSDPFVGQWKLVKLTDQMKVTQAGANSYTFDFGGGPETIVVDGTGQPGVSDTILSVAPDGANWKVTRKQGDRTLLTATWTLSADGNTLHDDFTSYDQDGAPSTTKYVYERKAAGSGFAGLWVSTPTAVDSGVTLQIKPYGNNGLTFILPSQTLNATFDGKESRRINARTVEIDRKSSDQSVQTRKIELSPDLKTLTMTVHVAGKSQPFVYVFEKL